jgi:hypothetical protein
MFSLWDLGCFTALAQNQVDPFLFMILNHARIVPMVLLYQLMGRGSTYTYPQILSIAMLFQGGVSVALMSAVASTQSPAGAEGGNNGNNFEAQMSPLMGVSILCVLIGFGMDWDSTYLSN